MLMWYQWTPLVAGLLAAWAAWGVPRAVVWVALILASFVLSSLWWNYVGLYPDVFGAATDFFIALIMLPYAKTTYEKWILRGLCAMILVDIFWRVHAIPTHASYAIALEALNYAVLALIAFWGMAERMPVGGRLPDRRRHAGWVGDVHRHLGREERYPKWWRVAG